MELRHLRYFSAVAQARSITRAAALLRVAQPALSRQLRQLEDEVGVRLFDRDQQGVQLTPAGEAFLGEANRLLEQSAAAIQLARRTAEERQGHLNLGYVWGLFHSRVPAVIAAFRRMRPEIGVHLFDLTATEQVQALHDGRLDAGFIGFAEDADAPALELRRVSQCALVAVLPRDHPLVRRRRVALRHLKSDLFLGISDRTYPGAWRHVLAACAEAGFRPRTLQNVERGHTILGLVAAGCGVALLPESLKALPHSGVVFKALEQPPVADLYLAWKCAPRRATRPSIAKTNAPSPVLTTLLEAVAQSCV